MRRLSDIFAEDAANCRSLSRLRALLANAAEELGFSYFALVHHAGLRPRAPGLLRLDNYPEEWASEFVSGDLSRRDPIHLASRRANAAFAWSEVGKLIRIEPDHRFILRRSERFGIGPGFTVPVNVPDEPSGSCSFAMSARRQLPRRKLMCAQLVGLHAFKAARRLLPFQRRRPHLSPRETQCLQLVVLGKSDWEIGAILGISAETARQYVKRARLAYGVTTRTQLAVLAVRDRRVRPEDLPIG